jgi:hypothetical protein
MAEYQLTATNTVQRASDGAFIPDDPANKDRREFEKWLAAGNTPDPYVAPPVPVPPVSPRQIRLALSAIGLRQQVEDYVNAHDITVQDSWHYTTEFDRNHPLIAACAAALGKTDADLDALFALAATL